MSPAEAADLIGCSEAFLRKKARRYEIPHTRVGKAAIKFTQADIDGTLAVLQHPPVQRRKRAA
jgi:excisionase family DNA binding protein